MKWNDDAFTVRRYIGIGGLVASAVVLALITRLTVAYLGDTTETAKNNLNVGYADVSIVEQFDEPSELIMSNTIAKEVKVQNNSSVRAFVRVYAEFSDSEIAKQAKVEYKGKKYSWDDFKTKLNYESPSNLPEDKDLVDSGWRYVPPDDSSGLGGYFYYIQSLRAYKAATGESAEVTGGITEPLFDSVVIDYQKYGEDAEHNVVVQDSSNIDRIVPLEMIVYSELIQTVDTGMSNVTTTLVTDDNGDYPAGETPTTGNVYGYDFDNDVLGNKVEWEDAWRRFLKLKKDRQQSETVKKTDEDNNGD